MITGSLGSPEGAPCYFSTIMDCELSRKMMCITATVPVPLAPSSDDAIQGYPGLKPGIDPQPDEKNCVTINADECNKGIGWSINK